MVLERFWGCRINHQVEKGERKEAFDSIECRMKMMIFVFRMTLLCTRMDIAKYKRERASWNQREINIIRRNNKCKTVLDEK